METARHGSLDDWLLTKHLGDFIRHSLKAAALKHSSFKRGAVVARAACLRILEPNYKPTVDQHLMVLTKLLAVDVGNSKQMLDVLHFFSTLPHAADYRYLTIGLAQSPYDYNLAIANVLFAYAMRFLGFLGTANRSGNRSDNNSYYELQTG